MKKILFIALIAFAVNAKAQIVLEHTYDTASTNNTYTNVLEQNQLMIINFAVSGERYVRINRLAKSICVYNMSHILLKTISFTALPSNTNGSVGEVLYISENLFSTDSKIAFMYVYYDPYPLNLTRYHTEIVNEDGNVLFSDTGVAAIHPNFEQQQMPIYKTSVGTKMILSYRNRQAKVFSLPGTLTTAIYEENNSLISELSKSFLSNPYPNPSTISTNIDYKFPDGITNGEIVFYDLAGTEIKRFKVDNTFTTLLVTTADIAAGTYYYQLQTTAQSSEGKKMVVIK